MTRTVLLTGFEPFDGGSINASWEAVRMLDGWSGDRFRVQVRRLPCVFGLAGEAMCAAIESTGPAIVIAVGQAGGSAGILVERVAVNLDDADIADNAGAQPIEQPVAPDGPAAWFATLPVKAIVRAIHERGLPALVSGSAGTFVCNHVFYRLMHQLAGSQTRAGFIHVPWLPEQAAARYAPCMELADIVDGLRAAIEVSLALAPVRD